MLYFSLYLLTRDHAAERRCFFSDEIHSVHPQPTDSSILPQFRGSEADRSQSSNAQ